MNFKKWLEAKAVSGEEYFYNDKTHQNEPVPVVFIRFGDLPKGNSTNHFLNKPEKGVSVVAAFYDRTSKKFILQGLGNAGVDELVDRPAYLVSGTPNGENGADGEQLLDRDSIKIIRKLDPNEITSDSDPWIDILGNDMSPASVNFPSRNKHLGEIRRKTFKIFNRMNLPKETNGYIGVDPRLKGSFRDYFHIIIEPMEEEKQREVYQAQQKANEELKGVLGGDSFYFTMDYVGSPRIEKHTEILFKIKNGKITL